MKRVYFLLFVVFLSYPVMAQIITDGSVWKYLDDGSDQGTAWRQPGFDDSGWASGPAQLGYGDGDEATVLSYGGDPDNKYITYYFRKTVTVDNPSFQNGLKIEILRDDGAVVYINGQEVVRTNMPDGNITYLTHASHTVSGSAEDEFFVYNVPSSVLVTGQNVVAVEVHQRNGTSSDLSFDLKMDFAELITVRKAPYLLYTGNNTEMMIMWQTFETTACALQWGEDTTYSSGTINSVEYGTDHQHKVVLTDLTPGVRYFYKMDAGGNTYEGSFIAGAGSDTEKFSFYAYGDTRSQPSKHNLVAGRMMDYVTNEPETQTLVVNSGDLVANGNNEGDWDGQFFSPEYENIQKLLANMPYLATLGNHEGNGQLFKKYFPYPMFASSRFYYSFDYANVHFVVLDQFTPYAPGSNQYQWLILDLQATDKPWRVVLMHEPGWSAGGHGNEWQVQEYLQPVFEEYGVYFVINGHNHYYSRAVVNGVNHITTGGGGAPLYDPNPNADSIVIVSKSYHFCKVDVDHDTITFTAIKYNNDTIESFKFVNPVTAVAEHHVGASFDMPVFGVNRVLYVNNLENRHGKIQVFDLFGSLVCQEVMREGLNKISIDKQGVYLVRILNADGEILVKKVLVH